MSRFATFIGVRNNRRAISMMDDFRDIASDDPVLNDILSEAAAAEKEGRRDDAVSALRRASDMGCTEAMVHLGNILIDGTADERAEAVSLFGKADAGGNSSGTRNLAYCYAVGIGVEKDKAKGAQLYIRAAEAGNARAMCNIGVMYEHGNGVPQDCAKAAEWFRRSAEGGYSRGMTNYACLLRDGNGVEKDLKAAEDWLWKSGSPRAKRLLGLMMIDGTLPRNEECARSLLEDASRTDSKAMVAFGDMIVDQDRARAVELYTAAAVKWNRDAKERLERLGEPIPEEKPRRSRKKD